MSLLWIVIGFSALTAVDGWTVRALLALIAVGVTAHILSRPTFRG